MIALDTSVLVRCPTLDDPSQVPAAKALLAHSGGVFVAKTVPLELEWVLHAAYKLTRPGIHSPGSRLQRGTACMWRAVCRPGRVLAVASGAEPDRRPTGTNNEALCWQRGAAQRRSAQRGQL